MILPLRVLGSASVKRIASGLANLPISLATCSASSALRLARRRLSLLERDEHHQRLALELVGPADGRGFGDRRVRDERALDLGGADAVAGDVEHVVDAADDPEVAVFVAARAVAGEVLARRTSLSTSSGSARRRPTRVRSIDGQGLSITSMPPSFGARLVAAVLRARPRATCRRRAAVHEPGLVAMRAGQRASS